MNKVQRQILTVRSDLKSDLRAHNCGKYRLIKICIQAM